MKESFSLPQSVENIRISQLETFNNVDLKKVIVERNGDERVIGAQLTIDGDTYFLDRDSAASEESINALLNHLCTAVLRKNSHNQLVVEQYAMTRLSADWKSYIIPPAANTSYSAPEMFTPKVNPLIDEGSIEKSNWRLEMIYSAKKLFTGTIPDGSVVICMPGGSDAEYSLWINSCGANLKNMVFVEGDEKKAERLGKQFTFTNKQPSVVTDWLGGTDKTFSKNLQQAIGGRPISVVSFDTESVFTEQLYGDLVDTLRQSDINDKFFFSLNLVSRANNELCQQFLKVASHRLQKEFTATPETARRDLVKFLPEILQGDTGLQEYDLVVQNSGSYLGNASVKMEYTYVGFSKR